jgi:hypothetical protein
VGGEAYLQYNADGTFNLATTTDRFESFPIASGTFWFEGTVFHTKDNLGTGTGTYEIRVQKEGDQPVRLSFSVIDDPDSDRAKDLATGMSWVEP